MEQERQPTTCLCALPGPWCCGEKPDEQGTVLTPDTLCPLSKPSLPRCSLGSVHPSPRSQLDLDQAGTNHPQTHRENGSFWCPQPSTMAAAAPACTSPPQLPWHQEDGRSIPLWDLGFPLRVAGQSGTARPSLSRTHSSLLLTVCSTANTQPHAPCPCQGLTSPCSCVCPPGT